MPKVPIAGRVVLNIVMSDGMSNKVFTIWTIGHSTRTTAEFLGMLEANAIEAIAELALARGIGARGLRSILEEILLNVMYHVPSDEHVGSVTITAPVVRDGVEPQLLPRPHVARATRRTRSA